MKSILFQLALALCLTAAVHAQTAVGGYILSNTTWTLANSPYHVTGNILVGNGVTLTIEPGVTVMFDTTRSLQIDGELIAIGTVQNRIVFTASDPTPVKGSWGRIQFSNTSVDAVFDTSGNYVSGSVFKYCDIQYGGGVPGDVTVYCDTAAPYFSNCRIAESLKIAIRFVQAVGRVDSSSIRNCGGGAIEYNNPVSAELIIKNDTVENNGGGIGRVAPGSFASAVVQNCVFTNTGNAVSTIASSASILISDNIFTSNATAIYIASGLNSTVENNVFTSNTNTLNLNGTNVNVLHNIFNGNSKAIAGGISGNAVISFNEFTGHTNSVVGTTSCQMNLVYPLVYSLRVNKLTVSNNNFQNNKGGIVADANNFVIENNTFINNEFIPIACSSEYGFLHFERGKGKMTGNIIDGNINSAPSGRIARLASFMQQWEVANNVIRNNTSVRFKALGVSKICGNRFVNNTGEMIVSSVGSSGAFIHDNEFLNNTSEGTTIYVNNHSDIYNNDFIGNTVSGANFIVYIPGGSSEVYNNRFLNNQNLNGSNPIVSISNSGSEIHNNDFRTNTGLSCIRIGGAILPTVQHNNFVNPGVQYEVENMVPFGSGGNVDVSNNYWGTTNPEHIDSVIKDYFDDGNLSVVGYTPVLSAPALVDTSSSCTSVVCALSVNGIAVNPTCFGESDGFVNITVSNGTPPYTYLWNTGATTEDLSNLAGGTYTVTVTDANLCSAVRSFTLTESSSALTVSGVVTNANCNSFGFIDITVSGGSSPYTYNWNNGSTSEDQNSLTPGSYRVTVTDSNQCSVSQSFVVGQDDGPIITGVKTDARCYNQCSGAINLSVTGAGPFTYDWGNGFGSREDTSGLCAGYYSVTVADANNCMMATSFTITSPGELTAAAQVASPISCSGAGDGVAAAVVQGGTPPYSYVWSNAQTEDTATGFAPGTHNVIVIDSLGCTKTASVTFSDGYLVHAGVIIGLSNADLGEDYVYSVQADPNYTYSWSVTNGSIISGQGTNGIEVTWTSAGQGSVDLIVTDQGCSTTIAKAVTVTDATGVQDVALENIRLYPNPTNSTLSIQGSPPLGAMESLTLTLFDPLGKQLLQQTAQPHELTNGVSIDMQDMQQGVYYLNLRTSIGSRIMKVVKY